MTTTMDKWGPTKPSEVVPGAFYLVKGHGSLGKELPDQVIRVLSSPRPAPLTYRATMVVNAWVFCIIDGFDMMIDYHQHDYPLDEVNVQEHGIHDRHLERIELKPDNAFHRKIHQRCFGFQGVVL